MVAADKGHVVSSDPKVAKQICFDLKARGIKTTSPSSIRLLGVDFAGEPDRATRRGRRDWLKLEVALLNSWSPEPLG